jgi:hypothetical protein
LTAVDLALLGQITSSRLGVFDIACPACGPSRRSPANRRRKVLRVWRLESGFVSYHCARCDASGCARDPFAAAPPDPVKVAAARKQVAERERLAKIERRDKARRLWSQRQPIAASPAEVYLREARGYHGPLPAALGYLPASGRHLHAMIAAYGLADEPEPGTLAVADDAVRAVHITRLALDGLGKAGTDADKITIASPSGLPIVLAPPNDLLGLVITEGIEDALSMHEATGLGAWAAGSAPFLPSLADAVPPYAESVTVCVDDDHAGWKHASELVRRLRDRGFEVMPRVLRSPGITV